MNNESSTWFDYNSDKFSTSDCIVKKIITRPLWFISCFINNIFPKLIKDKHLSTINFEYNKNDLLRNKSILPKSTPSRILCDLFWIKLDYTQYLDEKGFLNILDFGCGSCLYFERIKNYSGKKINYIGVDIYKHDAIFDYEDLENFKFIKIKEFSQKFFTKVFKDNNIKLIISQSVFEHIENDFNIFNNINRAIASSNMQITQFHMVPSAESIFHYFMHGVRQYTPRTISNLTLFLPENFTRSVISIGGKYSSNYFKYYHFYFRFLLKFKLINIADIKIWFHENDIRSNKLYENLEKDIIYNSHKALFYCIKISVN